LDDERTRQAVGYRPRYDLRGWVRHFIACVRGDDRAQSQGE
jgi:hypothetical protein